MRLILFIAMLLASPASAAPGEQPYPFHVRQYRFESRGQPVSMAYMHLRGRDGLPVVLLLHGRYFTAPQWRDTALWLNEKGYGVLIPDQIGTGRSSAPALYGVEPARQAEDTSTLVEAIGLRRLVVVSQGDAAAAAIRFTAANPHRAVRLVLINPPQIGDAAEMPIPLRLIVSGKAIIAPLPQATLYELKGLGQTPQIENFAAFTPALEKALLD